MCMYVYTFCNQQNCIYSLRVVTYLHTLLLFQGLLLNDKVLAAAVWR